MKQKDNVIEFPKTTKEEKSKQITLDLTHSIVDTMDRNGIDIRSENFMQETVCIIKVIRAVVDSQLGIKNDLSEKIKEIGIEVGNSN